jgi:RimJ/RimL family protein N-acetyltransferase
MRWDLTTERLLLRRWRDTDRLPFQAINADPRVMEFNAGPLTAGESDAVIERYERHFLEHGFGRFSVELIETGAFIGFIGFAIPTFDAPFIRGAQGRIAEIGWRLAYDYWGRGLATEGARAALQHAVETRPDLSLVAFTVPHNRRSRRVMEKIGMVHDAASDFDHTRLLEGHPLRRHVLYRLPPLVLP